MPPKANRWTSDADAKLFKQVMDVCDVKITGSDYDEIAKRMDEGFTAEAIKHRVRIIKGRGSGGGGGGGGGTPKTPSKKGANGAADAGQDDAETPSKRASGRKRAAKNYAEPETDDDDEEGKKPLESPTKKIKKEAAAYGDEDFAAAASFFDQDGEDHV